MTEHNDWKWLHLFENEVRNPRSVDVLREIDIGYLSKVYLILIDGSKYAVKMYDERYNGTKVCRIERDNIRKASQAIPDAVPKVIFCSEPGENEFQREILVMEDADGVPLNKNVFNEHVFEELISVLKRLHSTEAKGQEVKETEDICNCRKTIMQFLKEEEVIDQERFSNHLEALKNYYVEKEIFDFRKTIIHGDLWWDNILVDHCKITIIDWLESSERDYCRDLAQLRMGTLNEILGTSKSECFFTKLVDAYQVAFKDETLLDRIRYYVPLLYLQEAFYLPFNFFPWEIKYEEDAQDFKKRFIDYFEKSERYFRDGVSW